MNMVSFKLKKTDSKLLSSLVVYMNTTFKNERAKIENANKNKVQTCPLEEIEKNKALQYEFELPSETKYKNQQFNNVLINDLTKKQRTALLLNLLENYSIVEIAQIMGISKQTAQKHIDLAIQKIKLKENEILGDKL